MKKLLFSIAFALCGIAMYAQNLTLPPSGDNQKSYVKQHIGSLAMVAVEYSSPDVTDGNGQSREGKIWGQLVPYGMTDLGFGLRTPAPWRAGANENTIIKFSHDVEIEGKPLSAGKYGLHLIVNETGPWTWIFSKVNSAWGSYFYEEKDDALRVDVSPDEAPFHEWLTYEFTDRKPDEAELSLFWENKQVPMRIRVPKVEKLYVDKMRSDLLGSAGFTYQNWQSAAQYCAQNDVNLEEALTWADNAIDAPFVGQKNSSTLQTKSLVLMKLGKMEDAESTMMAAIDHPTAQPGQIHQVGRQLIGMGMPEAALKVFKANYEKFEGAWPTNVGMARGLAANGKYEDALKYAKLAHEEAPDDLNKNSMAAAIEKLEQGMDIN